MPTTTSWVCGVLYERYQYTPYGERTVFQATSYNATATSPGAWWPAPATRQLEKNNYWGLCEFGHQGKMHDEETGLKHNNARMYHPTLGRFMQRDPLGYVDGRSLYAYARHCPTRFMDPTGLMITIGPPSSPLLPNPLPGGSIIAPTGAMDNLAAQLLEFLLGLGETTDVTFNVGAGGQVSEQLWNEHKAIAPLKWWFEVGSKSFCDCACEDNKKYWSGLQRVQYTATGTDFLEDVVALILGRGMDAESVPNLRIEWLGSFTLDYQMWINCKTNTVGLQAVAYNRWSIQSLTRNPVTGTPLLSTPLRSVNQVIPISKRGTACD